MKLESLRLCGFKSFAEPSELAIEPGLTGVIGPNGCGKSNLLEALRWVMGETSAKNLRGGEMDDVIFAGTQSRTARNFAEVTLRIDNSDRRAPAIFNDADQIEVSRRIDRDGGSSYRVNGREARARDVQMMFADAGTGAHSASMVRQGQVAQIISAKPRQRRQILEDAAGIAGLHSRRKEAEGRLEGASANLDRLNDIIGQLESRVQSLKRQARQAEKYRQLSQEIRRAEAELNLARFEAAAAQCEATAERLAECRRVASERAERAAATSTAAATAAEILPGLRQREAEAAAALQRLKAERDQLTRERQRLEEDARALEHRLTQTRSDVTRETHLLEDAERKLEALAAEASKLDAVVDDGAARAAAEERLAAATGAVAAAEAAQDKAARDLAEADAAGRLRLSRLDDLDARARQTAARLEAMAREAAAIQSQLAGEPAATTENGPLAAALDELAAIDAALDAAGQSLDGAARQAETAEASLEMARKAERLARDKVTALDRKLAGLKSEAEAIASIIGAGIGPAAKGPPVLRALVVEPGYERAVAAGLGADLQASLDAAAAHHWRGLAEVVSEALPDGAEALSARVRGPQELARALATIGVVPAADGPHLQAALKPGQALVSRDGDLWRWDGLVRRADAVAGTAKLLEKKRRLVELEQMLASLVAELGAARSAFADAERAFAAADQALRSAKTTRAAAAQRREELLRARNRALSARDAALAASDRARAAGLERRAKVQSLAAQTDALRAEAAEIASQRRVILDEPEPPLQALAGALDGARGDLARARAAAAESRADRDSLEREAAARAARRSAVTAERTEWQSRAATCRAHIATLTERLATLDAERADLAAKPAALQARAEAVLALVETAEQERASAADALAEAEAGMRAADRAERDAQNAAAQAREALARAESDAGAAEARVREIAQQVRQALDCSVEELAALVDGHGAQDRAAPDVLDKRLDRLKRDREDLGGVNLRAEEELAETEAELAGLVSERSDLEGAILKLRSAIASLNDEGRARIRAAFGIVDTHFRSLFRELFRGGEAQLTLVESEDPLEAGLEILARPPGKTLQSLNLLSGGEQALTALALIFAVFQSNPSPVCVLDEVDAPLDDMNVERFCGLLEHLSRTTSTRFLVITHHALSMARMDRLYGVTMAERGVSQLVSVDLSRYERLRAAE